MLKNIVLERLENVKLLMVASFGDDKEKYMQIIKILVYIETGLV